MVAIIIISFLELAYVLYTVIGCGLANHTKNSCQLALSREVCELKRDSRTCIHGRKIYELKRKLYTVGHVYPLCHIIV